MGLTLTPKQINRSLAISVTRLLAHYPIGDVGPEARQLEIEDWIADLLEFGPELVDDACNGYRRGPDYRRRPLSGDIRKLCIDLQAESTELQPPTQDLRQQREERLERRKRHDEDMAREGREIANRWAQQRGHQTLEAYASAKGISYATACVELCRHLAAHSTVPPVPGFGSGVGNYASEIVGGGFTDTDAGRR